MSKILIIEDEVAIADLEKDYLELSGFEVEICNSGDEGLKVALEKEFDLIVLDLMLPGMDGFEVCKRVREEKNIPILMVSAKKDDIDKIRGLGMGADDYMTKPYSMDILICKIEAILRRVNVGDLSEEMQFDLCGIHFDAVRQTLGDRHLSSRENELLLMLCQNMDQTVDRNRILMALWGSDTYFNSRSLSVYINHLRNYIGKDSSVKILSVHGKGYKLVIMNEKTNTTEE